MGINRSIVIIGASMLQQYADNVATTGLTLTQEDIEALDALTLPQPLYPYRLAEPGGDPMARQALRG